MEKSVTYMAYYYQRALITFTQNDATTQVLHNVD